MHVAATCLCEPEHERDLAKPARLSTIIDGLTYYFIILGNKTKLSNYFKSP